MVEVFILIYNTLEIKSEPFFRAEIYKDIISVKLIFNNEHNENNKLHVKQQ